MLQVNKSTLAQRKGWGGLTRKQQMKNPSSNEEEILKKGAKRYIVPGKRPYRQGSKNWFKPFLSGASLEQALSASTPTLGVAQKKLLLCSYCLVTVHVGTVTNNGTRCAISSFIKRMATLCVIDVMQLSINQ